MGRHIDDTMRLEEEARLERDFHREPLLHRPPPRRRCSEENRLRSLMVGFRREPDPEDGAK